RSFTEVLRTADYGEASGSVTSFDTAAGLGVITGVDGTDYPFHCTAIADGTRDIAVGTAVTFTVAAGHLGKLEATQIR
ncbi:MAG: cold shock domain-containing protein, partial [Acidimicrobiales bacterium]|nr:cold shock domain-containing protein [Acidimicrobiales bacterium]